MLIISLSFMNFKNFWENRIIDTFILVYSNFNDIFACQVEELFFLLHSYIFATFIHNLKITLKRNGNIWNFLKCFLFSNIKCKYFFNNKFYFLG